MKKLLLLLFVIISQYSIAQVSGSCTTCPPSGVGNDGKVLGSNGGKRPVWVTGGSSGSWSLIGNSNATSANFLGTTNAVDLFLKTNGIERERFGYNGQWTLKSSFAANDTFIAEITNNAIGAGFNASRFQHVTNDGVSGVICLDASNFGKTRNYSTFGFTDYAGNNAAMESLYDSLTHNAQLHFEVKSQPTDSTDIYYTMRLSTDSGLVITSPLRYTDGSGGEGVGKVLTSDAYGNATWQGGIQKDSIALKDATVTLLPNTTHIVTATGTITDCTFNFPAGSTNDDITIQLMQDITSLTFSGSGISTITTPVRANTKLSGVRIFHNYGGNWY